MQKSLASAPLTLSRAQRWLALMVAFLGWMFAGVEMSIFPISTDAIIRSFHQEGVIAAEIPATQLKPVVGKWFTWYNTAFLFGAAVGGLVFGWLGDRFGRATAMGWSILCYSLLTGAGAWATSPEQLLVLRFLACLGIGGMWPNGVALANEAWPGVSRPALAGFMGAAANVGIVLLSVLTAQVLVTTDSWRWLMLVGAGPAVLGLVSLVVTPESPRWLASRNTATEGAPSVLGEVFTPPLLWRILLGTCLGAIPLLGAWGAQKWILLWSEDVGARSGDSSLKAYTQFWWAIGAVSGSLMGSWLAALLGRRVSYFLISLASLAMAVGLFQWALPSHGPSYMVPIFFMGLFGTMFFGWLPLYLPELFATRVRATGSGVSYNFGRFASAVVILSTGSLVSYYRGAYERVGGVTSFIYLAGLIIVFFMPTSTDEKLQN